MEKFVRTEICLSCGRRFAVKDVNSFQYDLSGGNGKKIIGKADLCRCCIENPRHSCLPEGRMRLANNHPLPVSIQP